MHFPSVKPAEMRIHFPHALVFFRASLGLFFFFCLVTRSRRLRTPPPPPSKNFPLAGWIRRFKPLHRRLPLSASQVQASSPTAALLSGHHPFRWPHSWAAHPPNGANPLETRDLLRCLVGEAMPMTLAGATMAMSLVLLLFSAQSTHFPSEYPLYICDHRSMPACPTLTILLERTAAPLDIPSECFHHDFNGQSILGAHVIFFVVRFFFFFQPATLLGLPATSDTGPQGCCLPTPSTYVTDLQPAKQPHTLAANRPANT